MLVVWMVADVDVGDNDPSHHPLTSATMVSGGWPWVMGDGSGLWECIDCLLLFALFHLLVLHHQHGIQDGHTTTHGLWLLAQWTSSMAHHALIDQGPQWQHGGGVP